MLGGYFRARAVGSAVFLRINSLDFGADHDAQGRVAFSCDRAVAAHHIGEFTADDPRLAVGVIPFRLFHGVQMLMTYRFSGSPHVPGSVT